jgi:hypothetical protein
MPFGVPDAAVASDLTSRVLAVVAADPGARRHSRTQRAQRRVLRISLAVTALGQLILAFPLLAGPMGTAESRMSWEAGALGIAVAVGFGYAALRPAVAAAMLPIALAVASLFLVEGVRDIVSDPLTLSYHTGHLVVLLQLALLWSLARTPLPRRRGAVIGTATVDA